MGSILYNFDTSLIVAVLFVFIVVGIEVGYRLGRWAQTLMVELTKSQINAVQASMLALLALILGFTFSLSLQRFDDRATAVVDEANAIGTTYLRTYLLPDSVRAEAQQLTREYVDYRLKAGSISLDEADQRSSVMMKSDAKLGDLWRLTAKAAREDGGPVTSGLFITSLNEMIDSFGSRDAIVKRHVPELVILLLFATFILTGVVIGYANGAEDHRPSIAAHVLALLIALLVFIIIDLDRLRSLVPSVHTFFESRRETTDFRFQANAVHRATVAKAASPSRQRGRWRTIVAVVRNLNRSSRYLGTTGLRPRRRALSDRVLLKYFESSDEI